MRGILMQPFVDRHHRGDRVVLRIDSRQIDPSCPEEMGSHEIAATYIMEGTQGHLAILATHGVTALSPLDISLHTKCLRHSMRYSGIDV